jgi:acyl carrier protein
MSREEFRAELEEILELAPGSLTGTEALADLVGWDSMALLGVIALADQKLGTVLSAATLMECTTLEELTDAVLGRRQS